MNTPVYTFLRQYADSAPLRMHMPGHKGQLPEAAAPELAGMYALDLTEISGADSLFEAEGILAESERNAARLFGTAATAYSCGGSTLCIQAMLYLMQQEGRYLVAARTVHRAFLNACVLLRLPVTWVYPTAGQGILSGQYPPEAFAAVLDAMPDGGKKACVYLTSPDYLGHLADVAGIAAVCHARGARLVVDNAHGAHLAFLPDNQHPMALGADLCCDSAHKMLPALTGCAYLHTALPELATRLKPAMALFGSTSPSYLMLASLDLCNVFLAERARSAAAALLPALEGMRRRLEATGMRFGTGEDLLHCAVDTAAMGYDGRQVGAWLEERGCHLEYIGREAVILLFSLADAVESVAQAERLLGSIPWADLRRVTVQAAPSYPKPERVETLAAAALAANETVAVCQAAGRICGAAQVPCPPAIPIVLPGERIDERVCNTLTYYGIHRIAVLPQKNPCRCENS